jgi:hypothetical protein
MLGGHLALRLLGNQGDQLLLPCVATIGAIGIVMLNRLPQHLLGTDAFGVEFGMATTQLLWFAVGVSAMVVLAGRFRDDGVLRHYKYTWALAGTLLLVITFLFGREVNGARLWIFLGPIGFQPGEAIKVVLVIFIAGYLAEKRTLLAGASARIGPIKIPPLPYLLPMIAIFVIVMLVVVRRTSAPPSSSCLPGAVRGDRAAAISTDPPYRRIVRRLLDTSACASTTGSTVRRPSKPGTRPCAALYAFSHGSSSARGWGMPTISGRLPIPHCRPTSSSPRSPRARTDRRIRAGADDVTRLPQCGP